MLPHEFPTRRSTPRDDHASRPPEVIAADPRTKAVLSLAERAAASDGKVRRKNHTPAIQEAAEDLLPVRERRKQVADELYDALVVSGCSFWDHIHPLFLARDITRHDIRELVRRGLAATRGNYRVLLKLFKMEQTDYKRFLNFLTAHECRTDFREFRNGAPLAPLRPRLVLPSRPNQRETERERSVTERAGNRGEAEC